MTTTQKKANPLDRSVAFSILLDVLPNFAESPEAKPDPVSVFLADWYADPGLDMYAFAQQWARTHTCDLASGEVSRLTRICVDEDCPQCGWCETYAEVCFDDSPPGARAHGCGKCGWRREAARAS